MSSDFLSKLSSIITEKINEFKSSNPDKSPFINDEETSADELARSAADVLESFMPKHEHNESPAASCEKRDFGKVVECAKKQLGPKPMVMLEPKPQMNISVFESKVGGIPYMPKDFDYPMGKSGIHENRPLRFLAQLNFDKLPHIEDFPEKGMLQFFCADETEDYLYGIDFDDLCNQNGFRVIYHSDIIYDESKLCTTEELPDFEYDSDGFPVDGSFILVPSQPQQCDPTLSDFRCDKLIKDICAEQCGQCPSNINGIIDLGFDEAEVMDFYYSENDDYSCIGGYPMFTQDDPRFNEDISDCDILLFQLCSCYIGNELNQILWGDAGIANFFIPRENLKKCDFSRVVYNWDCT